MNDSLKEISEEDKEYESEASQHLSSSYETSLNRSLTPSLSQREPTRGRTNTNGEGYPTQRETLDDNLSSGDEWQTPRSQHSSHYKRPKEPFELRKEGKRWQWIKFRWRRVIGRGFEGISSEETKNTTKNTSKGAEKKLGAKMHCPICSKDIYNFQRHLRQKHASPNPVQRVDTMATSQSWIHIYTMSCQKLARKQGNISWIITKPKRGCCWADCKSHQI